MKQLVPHLDPKITTIVIPFMGYLKQNELSKEIKIFFEEIVRMVTEENRNMSVIALL
jgi:hypothetical protein